MIQHVSSLYTHFCTNLLLIYFFSPPYCVKARNKVTEIINKAIIHYREDIDLQNLIDFGQREVRI